MIEFIKTYLEEKLKICLTNAKIRQTTLKNITFENRLYGIFKLELPITSSSRVDHTLNITAYNIYIITSSNFLIFPINLPIVYKAYQFPNLSPS